MDTVRAIADNSAGNINPRFGFKIQNFTKFTRFFSDPISPVPRRKESTPPRMGSPDQSAGEGGFGNSNGGSMSQSDLAAQVRKTIKFFDFELILILSSILEKR